MNCKIEITGYHNNKLFTKTENVEVASRSEARIIAYDTIVFLGLQCATFSVDGESEGDARISVETGKFYYIHLLHASLKVANVPHPQIIEFLSVLKSSAKSPEAFAEWNKELDEKGMKVLAMILDDNGKELALSCVKGFFKTMLDHYGDADRVPVALMGTFRSLNLGPLTEN